MTTLTNEKVVSTLNHLIVTCKDEQQGFHNAAVGVRNLELRQLFRRFQERRELQLAELQPEVLRFGGAPDVSGTISGTFHRGWLSLKQLLLGTDEAAVVAEAERSADIAVQSYQAALKEDLPHDLRIIVLRHFSQIQQAHDHLSAIKKRARQSLAT